MKTFKKIVLAFTLLVINLLTKVGINIYSYSSKSTNETADAAIVLGAAVWNGKPSPVFEERIKHAIFLYENNQVEYLIFTGGVGIRDERSEADVGREYAIQNGVEPDHIFTESESRITYQNLSKAKAIASNTDMSSYLIVSDPLHMKRSVVMAKDLGMNAFPSPTPTSKFESWKSKLPFLLREIYFYIHYQFKATFGLWNH